MGILKSAVKQAAVAAIAVLGKRIATKVVSKLAEKVAKPRVTSDK